MKICSEQKELLDTETECFIRDKTNIDDFIFEIDSGNMKKESANNFDQLDMIFVSGDSNVRPWSQSMRKIITIMRMCLKVQKHLFACGFGMQALIYLCATNFEKHINIINGEGNGGKLSEINEYQQKIKSLKQNDFFLDNTTGDVYGLNYENGEWVPKGNVGLHYRKSAQEYQQIGKYVIKSPIFRPNLEHNEKYKFFKSRNYEEICQIKKIFLHHWALEGMDSEFLVPLKNSWDMHNFNFVNPEKTFIILAESIRGGVVIECNKILASMFQTNYKYPNTLIPIKNFILHTLKFIKSQSNSQALSIQKVTLSVKNKVVQEIENQKKSEQQNLKQSKTHQLMLQRTMNMGFGKKQVQEPETDEFIHVGFSARQENIKKYYSQNAISTQRIPINANSPQQEKSNKTGSPSKNISEINSQIKGVLKNNSLSNFQQKINTPSFHLTPNQNVSFQIDNQNNNYNSKINNLQIQATTLSQGSIRKMLHPNINNEFLDFKKLWVPGQMTQIQKNQNDEAKNISHRRIFSETFRNSLNNFSKNNLNLQKQEAGIHKGITIGGTLFTPENSQKSKEKFVSQEEIQKQCEKENNKKILAHKTFRTIAKSDLNKEINDFVSERNYSQYNKDNIKIIRIEKNNLFNSNQTSRNNFQWIHDPEEENF